MFPKFELIAHHDEFHDVAKGAPPFGDAALEHAEILA
jgi:hypothetical protein